MKRFLGFGSFISGAALILSAQAAQAAATQIKNVQVKPSGNGFEVVLETNEGERPQVFTVNRGNALIADLVNTELQLPEGKSFEKSNPSPGIRSVTVAQLDDNSVRVTVNGDRNAPVGQVSQGDSGIVLNVSHAAGQSANSQSANNQSASRPSNQSARSTASRGGNAPVQVAQASRGDVMVPNPQITIDGVPAVDGLPEYSPPLVPRAVAPPLGDISVSNVESSPSEVSLGSNEVVPRLVLRDAPARDVLSLLARAAGMNVAYINATPTEEEAAQGGGAPTAGQDVRISLDIENEPVENVFNYVLRVAGLEANRVGRTIFVGPRLPDSARNVITRTLRMNQVSALSASTYLATLGAETRQFIPERTRTETVTEGGVTRTTQEIDPAEIQTYSVPPGSGPSLLQNLSVAADQRLNSVTLVGEPRKIQIAEAMLAQLDLRQRQVAVNVKIVDVNLLATEDFSTSFSWGDGDFFGVIDQGAAVLNLGRYTPPSAGQVRDSLNNPPIIPNPYEGDQPFLDPSDRITVPGNGTILPNGTFVPNTSESIAPSRPLGNNGNPLNPGIIEFDPGEPTVITRDADGNLTVSAGTQPEITSALPSLFQYPQRFLAQLQAQIVSGNAKVLTDPTLVVQEGETANVNLGQEVVSQVDSEVVPVEGGGQPIVSQTIQKVVAGLQMAVEVERVDDNGFVTLRIQPTVTAPVQTREVGDFGGEVTLLSVRQVQTGRIRLRDSQTLIVSGIIQETDRTSVTKVPILGDIPILGALFRSTNRENSRQEVIALVTPNVLDDSDFSNFGYRYAPSREVQEILQRRGVQVP
ncbi:MAG: AMIN domain-containing protein [Elainella sp.]